MSKDFSFLRLTNSFSEAKRGENFPVASLPYTGFIQLLPNETFAQKTNLKNGISLLGALVAELVDSCENVVLDLDGLFYYDSFTDQNGNEQIDFEFGMIGQDFYTMPLYLRLTDLGNGTRYYSNAFLVTHYEAEKSARFDYTHSELFYGIDYATKPLIQSIRLAGVYDHSPSNKLDFKQYTTFSGTQTNYRQTVSFLRKYIIEAFGNFENDRLAVLFSHPIVYIDGERVTVSDFKNNDRLGDTNWFTGEFVANKTGEMYLWDYQIFIGLEAVEFVLPKGWNGSEGQANVITSGGNFKIIFNKPIVQLNQIVPEIFKNGVSIGTANFLSANGNDLDIDYVAITDNTTGEYTIQLPDELVKSGIDVWTNPTPWTFTVSASEFDATEFDNSEFLV
jgi:hypothetical protein